MSRTKSTGVMAALNTRLRGSLLAAQGYGLHHRAQRKHKGVGTQDCLFVEADPTQQQHCCQ